MGTLWYNRRNEMVFHFDFSSLVIICLFSAATYTKASPGLVTDKPARPLGGKYCYVTSYQG